MEAVWPSESTVDLGSEDLIPISSCAASFHVTLGNERHLPVLLVTLCLQWGNKTYLLLVKEVKMLQKSKVCFRHSYFV